MTRMISLHSRLHLRISVFIRNQWQFFRPWNEAIASIGRASGSLLAVSRARAKEQHRIEPGPQTQTSIHDGTWRLLAGQFGEAIRDHLRFENMLDEISGSSDEQAVPLSLAMNFGDVARYYRAVIFVNMCSRKSQGSAYSGPLRLRPWHAGVDRKTRFHGETTTRRVKKAPTMKNHKNLPQIERE